MEAWEGNGATEGRALAHASTRLSPTFSLTAPCPHIHVASCSRFICDKTEHGLLEASNPGIPMDAPASFVLRSEMLDLAQTHDSYANDPVFLQRIQELPIVHASEELLDSVRVKAQRTLAKVGVEARVRGPCRAVTPAHPFSLLSRLPPNARRVAALIS